MPGAQYFSVVESNIIHLLDQLAADRFTDVELFESVVIEKDRVYFRWHDYDAVIEFNATSSMLSPWTFTYQHTIDRETTSIGETVCNYDIIVRLTELTTSIHQYEITNIKDRFGFYARIQCNFLTETPHVTFLDKNKKVLGHVKLNDHQVLQPGCIEFYKCKNVKNVNTDLLIDWANEFNMRYKMNNWELAQVMWDVSCKNKRPQHENNYNQNIVRLNDSFDEYEYDFE